MVRIINANQRAADHKNFVTSQEQPESIMKDICDASLADSFNTGYLGLVHYGEPKQQRNGNLFIIVCKYVQEQLGIVLTGDFLSLCENHQIHS